MRTNMPFEVEVKLPVRDDPAAVRRMLRRLGYRVRVARALEVNLLFDTPGRKLRRTGKLIRIRRLGKRHVLTFKGVSRASKHKVREEIETEASNPRALQKILDRLGFHPVFRYEKYRTEFARPGEPGVVTLDETPIGNYLEVEGPPRWIDRTARELGYTAGDYITASYGRLYQNWCRKGGRTTGNMVFGARHRGKI
jgi:adenylate cyclase, class 2